MANASLVAVAAIALLACTDIARPTVADDSIPLRAAIAPFASSLAIGKSTRLSAEAFDTKARPVNASFTWSSADPAIATVGSGDGVVMAISVGTTTVTATAGALRATAIVSVQPPPHPAGLSISTQALRLIVTGVGRLTASVYDSTGQEIGATLEWSSSDTTVAIVGKADGVVTAVTPGSANITVTSGQLTAAAMVLVTPIASAVSFTRETWSSDGRWTADVLSYSPIDQKTKALPRPSGARAIMTPAWTADGTRLAVEVIRSSFQPDNSLWVDYTSDLFVVQGDDSGSAWRQLTSNGLSSRPSWSPDGTRIAYVRQTERLSSDNDIYVLDVGSGTAVRVTAKSSDYQRPSWSPDGTRLVFSEWGPETEILFSAKADGTGLTRLTYGDVFDTDPSWSPDGTKLVFVSSRDGSASQFRFDVFVMGADGSNAKRLAALKNESSAPAWSPDGQQIIFSSGGALYVMNADGSSLVQLTSPPANSFDNAPAWRR